MPRYAGQLKAPAESFTIHRRLILSFGPKKWLFMYFFPLFGTFLCLVVTLVALNPFFFLYFFLKDKTKLNFLSFLCREAVRRYFTRANPRKPRVCPCEHPRHFPMGKFFDTAPRIFHRGFLIVSHVCPRYLYWREK